MKRMADFLGHSFDNTVCIAVFFPAVLILVTPLSFACTVELLAQISVSKCQEIRAAMQLEPSRLQVQSEAHGPAGWDGHQVANGRGWKWRTSWLGMQDAAESRDLRGQWP